MKLANLLMERRINIDLVAQTKDEAIRELLDMIVAEGVAFDYDSVLRSIREREEIEDTCYGHGFAFPHARTDAVAEMFILIGVSKHGMAGRTSDGQMLHVVCLLLTPSHIAKLYLQTLSGLATFARRPDSLARLLAAAGPPDIVKMISDANVVVDKELVVKDVMRHRVATVTPEDSLKDVANLMFRHRLSALAVVDHNRKLLGQISDRDLIRAALPADAREIEYMRYSIDGEPFEDLLKQEDKIKVAQLYRTDQMVASPNTRIVDVAAAMIFKDVRRVFVTDNDNNLVGVLLRKDIVNMVIRG